MADNDATPEFLELPFDWYILENWPKSPTTQTQRQTHIELGIQYAALGHEGRRPYVLKAYAWGSSNRGGTIGNMASSPPIPPRVPQDLLTSRERRINNPDYSKTTPLWIRTDYGPGTDDQSRELVEGFDDAIEYEAHLFDDAERYNLAEPLPALHAFFPSLLESDRSEYMDDYYTSFDSEEVQRAVFLTDLADKMAEEDRIVIPHVNIFLADEEAMRSGYILQIRPDQYGKPLLCERVQPWSLRLVVSTQIYRTLQEFRDENARGRYGNVACEKVVGAWEPA